MYKDPEYKIALITAVFGGVDTEKLVPPQEGVNYDRFYFNEKNTPFPMASLTDDRMKAKFFKTQSHRIPALAEYPVHCWIDGSIKVHSSQFLLDFMNALMLHSFNHITIGRHPDRKDIHEELEFIIKNIDAPYLKARYNADVLRREQKFYINEGFFTDGLYSCGIWMRWNGKRINEAFDFWWQLACQWSNFDQAQFVYAMHKHMVHIRDMPYGSPINNQYFKWINHEVQK